MKIIVDMPNISYGSVISSQYRNSICSGGFNNSPYVKWDVQGIEDKWIESFSIFAYCEDFSSERDYEETNNSFCIWAVRNIDPSFREIKKNGSFNSNASILPTDFYEGDRLNGWNGPSLCGYKEKTIWKLEVRAIIKNNSFYLEKVFGKNIPEDRSVVSIPYTFADVYVENTYGSSECNKEICPNGYSEINGQCVNDGNGTITEKIYIPCYYTLISSLTGEYIHVSTDKNLYYSYCYIFNVAGIPEFISEETGTPVPFKVEKHTLNKELPSDTIQIDAEYIQETGKCKIDPLHEFVSCDGTKTLSTTLNISSIEPIIGNVYNMSFCKDTGEFSYYEFATDEVTERITEDCECYKYKGLTELEKTHSNLKIYNDYKSDVCDVCLGCAKFKSCDNDEYIIVSFKEGVDVPDSKDLGNIFFLNGDDYIEDRGWRFVGYERCDINVGYNNIEIETNIECSNCNILNPYYRLTNCLDEEDVLYAWTKRGFNLDVTKTYVFDFNPDACYTVESLPMNCDDIAEDEYVIYSENIREVYDTCSKCNEQGYLIEDCETGNFFKPSEQEEISIYYGKVIKYRLNGEDRCGSVVSYRLGRYDYEEIELEQLYGCFSTCSECLQKVEREEEKCVVEQRYVEPHREEKKCCEQKQNNCKPKIRCYGPNRILR